MPADANACAAGGWCVEPHRAAMGQPSPDDAIATFAGAPSQPPLAAFRARRWATREADMQWTYYAYPAPADASSAATVMQGFDASRSWIGVANGAVYHWSSSLGMRGFTIGDGATPLHATARSADDLWVVLSRPPANPGERTTIHVRRWRAGVWTEVALTRAAAVSSVALDDDGALLVLGYVRQPPGYPVYALDRVDESAATPLAMAPSLDASPASAAYALASFSRDAAGALWLAYAGRLWRRPTGAMQWTELSTPLLASRIVRSERGLAAIVREIDGQGGATFSLADINSASLAVSMRPLQGAAIIESGLHVSNAALWRADNDGSFWRLAAR